MKKFLNPLLGLLFLALSGAVIFSSNLAVRFFPAQEVDLRGGFEFGRLLKGYLFVQEVTAAKDWLTAVDLGLAALGGGAPCENTLQVLDSGGQVLYTERFTSANISRMKYRTFVFPKKLHVGRGNKVTLCLSSANGSMDSSLVLPRKADGKLGKLSARPVINDDAAAALKGTGPVIRMEGSLCARTYESNWGSVNWLKTFLFFAAFLAASFIALADRLKPVMAGLRFAPEKIYVVLALVFGLALAFITPPLQTPDENKHLNRSYQLSEFNIFQFDTSVPASLLRLSETFKRLNFDPLGKTSPGEIFSQRRVALDPASRSRDEIAVPTFIFPYFPQALGIFTGRLFNASPITLLYAGRIFNLLFSIALVYFAIRTAPFFKWVFFLLGLMPMTLYLSASLAKDAMIFSLSFLLIAFFLRFSYGGGKELRAKELAVLFVLSFLTAASRPIYLVLAGLFLLI
ncbi:MAG: DUF2142 domain-containing protein, partial [Elusimicrobia bacterium]|nr:DUF2142 domain-containing protein [Elusimicrobiota bacterium]